MHHSKTRIIEQPGFHETSLLLVSLEFGDNGFDGHLATFTLFLLNGVFCFPPFLVDVFHDLQCFCSPSQNPPVFFPFPFSFGDALT
jgi:hypothetical protein